jgi:hypothetical protein
MGEEKEGNGERENGRRSGFAETEIPICPPAWAALR